MTRITRMDSTRTGKRITLAAVVLLSLSTILPQAVVAQNSPLSRAHSTTIDAQMQNGSRVIPSSFYGMYIKSSYPWPTSYFANLGLDEENGVNWANIEVAPGVYDYNYLDQWIALAQQHNVSLLYRFDAVPAFYSSNPNDSTCAYAPGACDPPKDLNEDGTGTDAAFENFVTALVAHNAELGNPIQYWEMWNEPNQRRQWFPTCQRLKNCYNGTSQCTGVNGTNLCYSQLLRMAADAWPIIKAGNPNAVILTPAPVGYPSSAELWMKQYLRGLKKGGTDCPPAGVCPVPDVIAFDGYVNRLGQFPIAENEYKLIKQLKSTIVKQGFGSKPMWINAGGWGHVGSDGFNGVLKAAFLARYILLQQSTGISRAYWHQWDDLFRAGHLRLAGDAYNSIVNWTTDATLTSACSRQKGSSVWVCNYSRSNPAGYRAKAVWNAKKSSTYTLKEKFAQYCDLKGNVKPVHGRKVPIGIWPILLENENLGQGACQQ